MTPIIQLKVKQMTNNIDTMNKIFQEIFTKEDNDRFLEALDIEQFANLLKGADINKKNTALMNAALRGNIKAMELLLENGADVNAKDTLGNRALDLAAGAGHIEAVELLLKHGAHIDARDRDGNTAFITATRCMNVEIAKLLLENGADINAQNNEKSTALGYAVYESTAVFKERNMMNMVRFLLEQENIDLNIGNSHGKAPAILACMHSRYQHNKASLDLLVDHGADVNIQDKAGKSLLMYVAANRDLALVQRLLEKNVDVLAKDSRGKTVLDYSRDPEITELLEKFVKRLIEKNVDVIIKDSKVTIPTSATSQVEPVTNKHNLTDEDKASLKNKVVVEHTKSESNESDLLKKLGISQSQGRSK